MPGPVYDDCPGCGGTGQGQDWSTGNLIECPYCRGLGREVTVSKQERRRHRDPYIGMGDRIERNFMKIGLGVLLVYILFIFAIIGALIALIIYLV